MGKRIITDSASHPIQPQQIDATKHLWEAFGHHETEVSAGWIVRLCQKLGSWGPFTKQQLEAFYNEGGHKNFWFNGLDSDGYIVVHGEQCQVTHEFVSKCFQTSPAVSSITQG